MQAQLGGGEQEQQQGSFLDSMREAVLGRREPRGSVPNVRSPATQTSPVSAPPYGGYQPGHPGQSTDQAGLFACDARGNCQTHRRNGAVWCARPRSFVTDAIQFIATNYEQPSELAT